MIEQDRQVEICVVRFSGQGEYEGALEVLVEVPHLACERCIDNIHRCYQYHAYCIRSGALQFVKSKASVRIPHLHNRGWLLWILSLCNYGGPGLLSVIAFAGGPKILPSVFLAVLYKSFPNCTCP